MARLVMVHGIGQQHKGEHALLTTWYPALLDGLAHARSGLALARDDVAMGFYGDLFRPPGRRLAAADPHYTHRDISEGLETDLLMEWWEAAAHADDRVVPPSAATLARSPRSVQNALRALNGSAFFSGIAQRALIFDLKQVSRYLSDTDLRQSARKRILERITPDTQVVIAHSLGSVVAYEALCSIPDHSVRALVTLGSPLGLRLIFDRLDPAPNPQGAWPSGAWPGFAWTNVADPGDVVAVVADLKPQFGSQVSSVQVHNGPHAHKVVNYLTDAATGNAIANNLAHG
ncbi:hypothetical protein [Nocardiopsis lambiniae]|uniref:Uncharacterized protein n=1 Tax=Nocardiopsis lambiniae TaxID=3075539 RepID=A0ABU2MFG5_9ACTN|nr:hypothetical protein [Nocardiopsis sp. DSM 44743]MDT0331444.1 hypothetical protein [Nocardiopsis sp. DSM 44743]